MPAVSEAEVAAVRPRIATLARNYARRSPWWVDRDSVPVVAEEAFWKARQTYDPARGWAFSTWAFGQVRNALILHCGNQRAVDRAVLEEAGAARWGFVPEERTAVCLRTLGE